MTLLHAAHLSHSGKGMRLHRERKSTLNQAISRKTCIGSKTHQWPVKNALPLPAPHGPSRDGAPSCQPITFCRIYSHLPRTPALIQDLFFQPLQDLALASPPPPAGCVLPLAKTSDRVGGDIAMESRCSHPPCSPRSYRPVGSWRGVGVGILGKGSMVSEPLTPDILKDTGATKNVLVHWREGKLNLGRYRLKFISWTANKSSQGTDKKVTINYCILGIFYSLCQTRTSYFTWKAGTPHPVPCYGEPADHTR